MSFYHADTMAGLPLDTAGMRAVSGDLPKSQPRKARLLGKRQADPAQNMFSTFFVTYTQCMRIGSPPECYISRVYSKWSA